MSDFYCHKESIGAIIAKFAYCMWLIVIYRFYSKQSIR